VERHARFWFCFRVQSRHFIPYFIADIAIVARQSLLLGRDRGVNARRVGAPKFKRRRCDLRIRVTLA
jgi:hypothetical protein